MEIIIWGKDDLRTRGMNGILAVNAGSDQPPAFVALVTLALLALTVLESLREDPSSLGGT